MMGEENRPIRSPFPGMDPYLERYWRDVHSRLVVFSAGDIQRQLGGGLRARIDERLVVESPVDESRSIYPDVRVIEHGLPDRPIRPEGGVAVAEPVVIEDTSEKAAERFIEIIDTASGGRLITVIEFVSPSNKHPGDGQDQYLQKQQEVIDAGVNLVEIDLTRSGRRRLAYPVSNLPAHLKATYYTCVYRGHGFRRFEIYPMPLRERLPAIWIPLRAEDKDIVLDIQALVDRAYEEGRYDDIDYGRALERPLEGEEAAWVGEVLAGRRG